MAIDAATIEIIKAEIMDLANGNVASNAAQTALATAQSEFARIKEETAAQRASVEAVIAKEEDEMLARHTKLLADTDTAIGTAVSAAQDVLNKAQMQAEVTSTLVDKEIAYLVALLTGQPAEDPTPAQIVNPPAPVEPVVVDVVPEEIKPDVPVDPAQPTS